MPADLPPGESAEVARVMLRLHAEFRRRRGLSPVPSAWTLLEDLQPARGRLALNDAAVLRSPRPVIGPIITGVRWMLWKLLQPVFDRQTEANRDLVDWVEALARYRDQRRYADFDLSVRVTELERKRAGRDEGGS